MSSRGDVGPVGDDIGGQGEATGGGYREALVHRCSLPPGARLRWCGSSRGTCSTVCPIPSVPPPSGVPSRRCVDLAGDVYAFQELDRGRVRTRFAHQARDLANALDGELVWARAKHWLWASQSNALVVRGEVLTAEVIDLPGGGEQRVAAVASVVTAGERWSVATAHLSLEPGVARRQLRVTLDAAGGAAQAVGPGR